MSCGPDPRIREWSIAVATCLLALAPYPARPPRALDLTPRLIRVSRFSSPLPGSAGVDTLELGSLTNRLCIGSYRYECFRRPPEYAPRRSLPEGRYRPRGADNGRDTFAHKTIDADARVIGNPESILTKPGIMRQQLTLIAAVRVEQECRPQGP